MYQSDHQIPFLPSASDPIVSDTENIRFVFAAVKDTILQVIIHVQAL